MNDYAKLIDGVRVTRWAPAIYAHVANANRAMTQALIRDERANIGVVHRVPGGWRWYVGVK